MDAGDWALIAAGGVAAGGVNAVAGGGSLVSFPALLAAGLPSLTANATNLVALLPGYASGSLAYRRELGGQGPRLRALGLSGAVGGVAGAVLLVLSSPGLFRAIVPWLVLAGCALLAVQDRLAARVAKPRAGSGEARSLRLHAANVATAIYGGYFGAGIGIVLLAVLGLFLPDDMQRLNALKGLLSLVIGVAAGVYLALFGPVRWGPAGVVAAASVLGAYLGVGLARRLDERLLRWLVVAFGVAVAIVLLVRQG